MVLRLTCNVYTLLLLIFGFGACVLLSFVEFRAPATGDSKRRFQAAFCVCFSAVSLVSSNIWKFKQLLLINIPSGYFSYLYRRMYPKTPPRPSLFLNIL